MIPKRPELPGTEAAGDPDGNGVIPDEAEADEASEEEDEEVTSVPEDVPPVDAEPQAGW